MTVFTCSCAFLCQVWFSSCCHQLAYSPCLDAEEPCWFTARLKRAQPDASPASCCCVHRVLRCVVDVCRQQCGSLPCYNDCTAVVTAQSGLKEVCAQSRMEYSCCQEYTKESEHHVLLPTLLLIFLVTPGKPFPLSVPLLALTSLPFPSLVKQLQ